MFMGDQTRAMIAPKKELDSAKGVDRPPTLTEEKPRQQQSRPRPPLQSGPDGQHLEESKEDGKLPPIDTNSKVKDTKMADEWADGDGAQDGLDWGINEVSENVLKDLPHTIGADGIMVVAKEDYEKRMRQIREGKRIEKQPKIIVKEPFKPDAPDTVFWDPETRCRQFTRDQDKGTIILQYPVKSFTEYLNKIKPARIRTDIDRCKWLAEIMITHPPEQSIFKVVSKDRNGKEHTKYEYQWATRTYEHQDLEKVYRLTIQANYHQPLLRYFTSMVKARIPVNLAHETLMKYTNLCINHAYGACPHMGECKYFHDDCLHNVMSKYIEALNIIEDSRNHKRPAQMSEVAKFKETINNLFIFWTGKPCNNIQHLFQQSYFKNHGLDPSLAARIIRQVCLKHVPYYHVAVGRACYILQDWTNPDRVGRSPWAQTNYKKEQAQFNILQKEFGTTLEALMIERKNRDEISRIMFKVPFIPDMSCTYKRLHKQISANTYWKQIDGEEIVSRPQDMLSFDDTCIFDVSESIFRQYTYTDLVPTPELLKKAEDLMKTGSDANKYLANQMKSAISPMTYNDFVSGEVIQNWQSAQAVAYIPHLGLRPKEEEEDLRVNYNRSKEEHARIQSRTARMDELNDLRAKAIAANKQQEIDRLYEELSAWCCETGNIILNTYTYHYHQYPGIMEANATHPAMMTPKAMQLIQDKEEEIAAQEDDRKKQTDSILQRIAKNSKQFQERLVERRADAQIRKMQSKPNRKLTPHEMELEAMEQLWSLYSSLPTQFLLALKQVHNKVVLNLWTSQFTPAKDVHQGLLSALVPDAKLRTALLKCFGTRKCVFVNDGAMRFYAETIEKEEVWKYQVIDSPDIAKDQYRIQRESAQRLYQNKPVRKLLQACAKPLLTLLKEKAEGSSIDEWVHILSHPPSIESSESSEVSEDSESPSPSPKRQ